MTQAAGIKILYIENGRPLSQQVYERLQQAGICVSSAESNASGLSQFDSQLHQVIIVDYDASLNGHHPFLREWQRREEDTPVIVVSQHTTVPAAIGAMKLGASDYLVQSEANYSEKLIGAIGRVYQQYQTTRQNSELLQRQQQELRSLEKRNHDLAQLNAASHKLTSTLDSREVMTQMLEQATNIIGARDASVWTWEDTAEQYLVCHATSNRELFESLRQYRLRQGEGVAGWVIETGRSTIVGNTASDDRFSSSVDERTGFQTESLLAVPMRVRSEVIGVLEILNKDKPFDQEDIVLGETLAASAAIALENARLIEKLQDQKVELQARNAELDAFAHTVAHDLKTPLNWVNGYIELLIKDWDRLGEEERVEYAAYAQNGAHTMSNIIDDLLLLASLRKPEVVVESIDMRYVLRSARRRLEPMIKQNEATLTSPMEYPLVKGYGPWIEGVWVNYITNAIKYGGEPPEIKLGFTDNGGDMVCFWVEDNGAGLTLDQQTQLFKTFSRLGQNKARGHGLGLSIVQRIVEKLGGLVGVESEPGRGSRFTFSLPKA